jgi:SWI/SNF-related matrix-associated actin-dependent regulator of chromatin subfamily A3
MSRPPKRSAEFIDLTDDTENHNPKRVNHSQSSNGSSQVVRSQWAGSSSQPPASQSLYSSTQRDRDAWQESNEEFDVIDLSQDVDEGFGWVLIGAIMDKIVGVFFPSISVNAKHKQLT